ncbi:MAG: energy transducer TonB [Gammaproteobacteria bacterium]|nr:energy transducer TonB [Gammaproteobacteria bacterium]
MDNTDFILRDSEATSQVKRLELDTLHTTSTSRRLSASIILSVLLHGGAIAAVAGVVNEFSNAIPIKTPAIITAHLVAEASINSSAVEASKSVSMPSAPIGEPVEQVEIPKQEILPEQIPNQSVEEELKSVVTNVESPTQTPKDETSKMETETVDSLDSPQQKFKTNMLQPDESEPAIDLDKKTTQGANSQPNASDKTEIIESSVNAVTTETLARSEFLSSQTEITNQQPLRVANANRSVVDGLGQQRDAAPASGNAKPRYPRIAIKKGYEGSVVLHVTVSADGDVKNVAVGTGSGYRSLDKSAVSTVKRWRFKPAFKNGEAVESVAEVPVVFRLVDAKS